MNSKREPSIALRCSGVSAGCLQSKRQQGPTCIEPGTLGGDIDSRLWWKYCTKCDCLCFGISRACYTEILFEGLQKFKYLSFTLLHYPLVLCALCTLYSHQSFKCAHDLRDVPRRFFCKALCFRSLILLLAW